MSLPPIETITQARSYWYRVPRTNLIGAFADYSDWSTRYDITDEYLAYIHPDLPGAVDALITHNGRTRGPEVDAMIKIVTGCAVRLPLVDGTTATCSRVRQLTMHSTGLLRATADITVLVPVLRDTSTFYVVHDVKTENINLDRNKLDVSYPEWEERLRIGNELEHAKEDLMAYVFSSNKGTDQVLPPDVSFG